MCELFGVTSDKKILVNEYLKKFFGHSNEHPSGWGLSVLDETNPSIIKEAIKAENSNLLKGVLEKPLKSSKLVAHIRRATIGHVEYKNSHPFSRVDASGREWIFVHNGTIFDAPVLNKYQKEQEGETDSERILLYIIDRINEEIVKSNIGAESDDATVLPIAEVSTFEPREKETLSAIIESDLW